MSLSNVPGFE